MQTPLGRIHIYCLQGRPLRIVIRNGTGGETEKAPHAARRCVFPEAVLSFFKGEDCPEEVRSFLLDDPRFTFFQKKVYGVVCAIPRGSTLSYGEAARKAGFAGAARAVGCAMRRNPFPLLIPCHRVIRSDGRLGEYSGPPHAKAHLLTWEGVEIEASSQGPRLRKKYR